MKKIFYAMILGSVFIMCTLGLRGTNPKQGSDVQELTERTYEREKPDCSTATERDWTFWLAQLEANEARTEAMWKGKCVRVSGTVKSVDSGVSNAEVVIGSGTDIQFQTLHCQPSDPRAVLRINKGQAITVWGMGSHEILGSLFMKECKW